MPLFVAASCNILWNSSSLCWEFPSFMLQEVLFDVICICGRATTLPTREIIGFASSFEHGAHKSTLHLQQNRHGWADKDWNWGSPFGTAHDEAICIYLHLNQQNLIESALGLEAMALRERLDTKETSGVKSIHCPCGLWQLTTPADRISLL